jgi:hypothetical protein
VVCSNGLVLLKSGINSISKLSSALRPVTMSAMFVDVNGLFAHVYIGKETNSATLFDPWLDGGKGESEVTFMYCGVKNKFLRLY